MPEIKPIETFYKGYRFRSRLEARWAVFFDVAGIEYEYEPEGYKLSDGTLYLPDFYLPAFDTYVEVKRDTEEGRKEVIEKCNKAITWGGNIKQLVILSDIPEGRSVDGGIWHFPGLVWQGKGCRWVWWFFHDGWDDGPRVIGNMSYAYLSSYSDYHGFYKNSIKAISDYEFKRAWPYRYVPTSIKDDIATQEECNCNTFKAFAVARQTRFEHGETPNI